MNPESPPAADDLRSGTIERIRQIMILLGIAGLITVLAFRDWRTALGFALGGFVAYVNFYWLEKVVRGVVDLTIRSGKAASSGVIVRRFLLRYVLMAVVAFVILTVSRESLYGLFAGLLLPVAAMLCEAAYEAYRAIRKT